MLVLRNKTYRHIGSYLFVILLSFVEFRLILLIHAKDINDLAHAAYGIVIGEPHWIEYQNRLIGPYLVKIISDIFAFSYIKTYLGASIGLHILKNCIFFLLVKKLTKNCQQSIQFAIFFVFCFLIIQHTRWLYLWDYFDVIIFTIFIYGVFTYKKNLYYGLLFCIAIFNKESCLFIPAWMVIDAIVFKGDVGRLKFHIKIYKWQRLIIGIVLLIIGIVLTKYIREALLIREVAAPLNVAFAMERPFHFKRNVNTFIDNWSIFYPSLNFLVNIWIVAIPSFALAFQKYFDDTIFKLVISVLMIYFSILLFGLIDETRIYSILIPYINLMWLYLGGFIKKRK
jgi:hypothetical protein